VNNDLTCRLCPEIIAPVRSSANHAAVGWAQVRIQTRCHSPPAPSASLDLTAGTGYGALVGVPSEQCAQRLLVSPGNPGESYLLDKIVGQNLCSGTQMPKSAPLSASQIQAVSDWICTGATH
jgi:hypothetical protein